MGKVIRDGVANVVIPGENSPKLSHQRLGHAGGKGMQILTKKKRVPSFDLDNKEFYEYDVHGKHNKQV